MFEDIIIIFLPPDKSDTVTALLQMAIFFVRWQMITEAACHLFPLTL